MQLDRGAPVSRRPATRAGGQKRAAPTVAMSRQALGSPRIHGSREIAVGEPMDYCTKYASVNDG